MKIAAAGKYEHRGPARVFDCEEDCFKVVQAGGIKPGDVVVIRYEGPKGGPGMREMLQVTAAISSNAGAERARWRCLPMGDSAARRADLPRATWLPRHLSAGRSRRCARATSLHSTFAKRTLECGDQRGGDGGAAQEFQAAGAALAEGRLPQVCGSRDVGIGRGNDVRAGNRQQGIADSWQHHRSRSCYGTQGKRDSECSRCEREATKRPSRPQTQQTRTRI